MSFDHIDLGLTEKNNDKKADAGMGGGCCGGGGCMCGHGAGNAEAASTSAAAAEAPAETTGTAQEEYLVQGMTCSHCVSSVTEELSALDGVQSVAVQLDAAGASRVTVATSRPLDLDAVRAAVDEAGYSLVDTAR